MGVDLPHATSDAELARCALTSRLRSASLTLGVDTDVDPPQGADNPAREAAVLLERLVSAVHDHPTPDRIWLLLIAVSAAFPAADDVDAARRMFELSSRSDCSLWLLEEGFTLADRHGSPLSTLTVVQDRVVADVDFCARHDLQTGIQRVVREVMPRWQEDSPPHLVAWTQGFGAMRSLTATERLRVLDFARRPRGDAALQVEITPELVVPWRTTVFLPEVPTREQSERLMSLARHSGNHVVAIGYDCIPVVDADLLPVEEPAKFVHYLATLKHIRRVIGISRSAAAEFAGFASMLPTQGLTGPDVVSCELPVEVPQAAMADGGARRERASVLVVGSHDPRKNHLSVLHAAERLWREGNDFELRLIGGKGYRTEPFDRLLNSLRRAGRPIRADRSVGDDGLWAAYRDATFTVFPSLHEGYGLPVAESLACHTPVITTGYGSTAEIALGGGALTVDPRDDDMLTDAMRSLLNDPDLLHRLREEAAARPTRTWDDYSLELRKLVEEAR